MGRSIPTECPHGKIIDWGDFGPDDGLTEGCDVCDIPPEKTVEYDTEDQDGDTRRSQ